MEKINGQYEKLRFKIIGFNFFENSENVNDCIAISESGEKFNVDPFVGGAFDYELKEHLLNEWWEGEGHWHENLDYNCPMAFLIKDGKFKKNNT